MFALLAQTLKTVTPQLRTNKIRSSFFFFFTSINRESLSPSSIWATFYVYSCINQSHFLILIFRTFRTSNIQTRRYLMIVRTADKPGYTYIPQHTMKMSSDCNRKVVVCLITHFTRVRFFVMFSLFLQGRFFWREDCVGWGSFSFKLFFCFVKMHALMFQSQRRQWSVVLSWTRYCPLKEPFYAVVDHGYKNIDKISLIQQHSQYSISSAYIDH